MPLELVFWNEWVINWLQQVPKEALEVASQEIWVCEPSRKASFTITEKRFKLLEFMLSEIGVEYACQFWVLRIFEEFRQEF